MKLECIQKVLNALKEQGEKPFAVLMSPKNYERLINSMKSTGIIFSEEDPAAFGIKIKAHKYFPEDSILCVTKDGYEKIKGEAISNLLNLKSETREERAERIKRLFLDERKIVDCNVVPDKTKVLEWYEKLEELLKKEITMQEIMKDDTVGEVHVEDTIEDLIPFIKASLAKPDVKYVKVFSDGIGPEKCRAEEEKKNIMEKICEQEVKE